MTKELIDYHKTKMCLAGAEGRTEDYKFHKAAIELFEKLSLPSDIDEAAEEALDDIDANWQIDEQDDGRSEPGYNQKQMLNMFKAGAEWREQQIPKLPNNLDEASINYAYDGEPEKYGIEFAESNGNNLRGDKANAFKAGARWRDAQFHKLPDNVGEAAEEYVQTLCDKADDNLRIDTTLQSAFKAGAEWMAGQGETVEGDVDGNWRNQEDVPYEIYVTSDCLPQDTEFKFGDKVVVQIRKK